MKIVINYDLVDKAIQARTGFSLRYYCGVVGFTNGLAIPAVLLGSVIGDADPMYTFKTISQIFGYSLFINGLQALGYSIFRKKEAIEALTELSTRLSNICIETDENLLKEARQYKVGYGVNFDSFPPKIEQRKYIMVPVHNEWENNERSLVQEHVIGSNIFSLSYGEPEKNKVYSYSTRKMISK